MSSGVRRALLAVILVAAGLVWLRVDEPIEGRVLLELTPNHGITSADLLSVAAFAAAVILLWPGRRRD